MLGGSATATGLFALSGFAAPLPTVASIVLVAAIGALALADAFGLPVPRLQNRRQIPIAAFDPARRLGAARFGFELGTGLRTYVTDPSPQIVAVALLVVAGPWTEALATGAAFGLARGWLPISRTLAPDRDRWDERHARRSPLVVRASIVLVVLGSLFGRGLV